MVFKTMATNEVTQGAIAERREKEKSRSSPENMYELFLLFGITGTHQKCQHHSIGLTY